VATALPRSDPVPLNWLAEAGTLRGGFCPLTGLRVKRREKVDGQTIRRRHSWHSSQENARRRPDSTSESAHGAAAPATKSPWFGASRSRQRRRQARPTGLPIARTTTAVEASRKGPVATRRRRHLRDENTL